MSRSFAAVAALLDTLSGLGGVLSGLIALALCGLAVLAARRLQRRLVERLTADPDGTVRWLRLELEGSAIGLIWIPVDLVIRGVRRLTRLLRRRGKGEAPPAAPAAPPKLVVATLGPSFLLGGLATAGLYGLSRGAGIFLRAQLGLLPGTSGWEYLAFGRHVELGPYLPLAAHPYLDSILSVFLWLAIGGALARLARFLLSGSLGRNLAALEQDDALLPFWRRWAGAGGLWRPDASYSDWAVWVVAGASPLLVWVWISLDAEPWRIEPSEAAVALVVWLFWAIHLLLRGVRHVPEQTGDPVGGETQAGGWPEVLEYLRERLQVAEPDEVRAPRPVEALQLTQLSPQADAVISPLVLDLLPAPGRLTGMQRIVLTDLSLQAFVHVEPPAAGEALALQDAAEEVVQDRSGLRHRNQVVLAPEAAGKSTLAVLAAANHALVHARATLVVARDERHEEELEQRFRALVDPSTLRWNVRVRRVGGDLMSDLSLGIVPDVIVCSLHNLVLHILGNTEPFAPFLQSVGLIVVDDVELFCGPVETHAQLVFRRLTARLRRFVGVQELGERSAPLVLVLGTETMRDLPAWARALCGIDAVTRDFSRRGEEQEEREAAELAAQGIAARPQERKEGDAERAVEALRGGRHQVFYRLRDFRTAAGDFLGVAEIVAVCEQLAVPWHYRPCGDGRRRLGRRPLLLRDEPKYHTDSPADACVVFLEGRWSEVRRERDRLRRAGARFSRRRKPGAVPGEAHGESEPIAFVSVVDPDEEMAFTQLDGRFGLAPILAGLPEPVIRPPSGLIVQSHLSADLVQHWMEVAEVLEVFGQASAQTLRGLSRGGLLLTDRRIDVHPEASLYVPKLYVRALARAAGSLAGFMRSATSLLPPPVQQVELVSAEAVAVRDRTRQGMVLLRVDAASAAFLYYPGRIFTEARGSFVVVGRAGEGARDRDVAMEVAMEMGDILVDPFLGDDLSSPRRRIHGTAPSSGAEPESLLLGRCPLAISVGPSALRARHVATYRLGPLHAEVRQRQLRRDESGETVRLSTMGLAIYPNPELEEGAPGGEAPRLSFAQARLLAAALRALLPSLMRGAAESLGVALHLTDPEQRPEPGYVLAPREGILLFDLDQGGNGTVQAIHREGIETLLRLCRLLIERVLQPDRLLALHDEWGDEAETLADRDLPSGAAEADVRTGAADGWRRYGELRKGVLTWLDSRLRPEGRTEGAPGETGMRGGDYQEGEGDVIDLGRCWSSRNGMVTDLVWVKHRWRLPDGAEAMLDVGFDRSTVARARRFNERSESLEAYRAWHAACLETPSLRLPDGTVWGAPREVKLLAPDGEKVEIGREGLGGEALAFYHPFAAAVAAHGQPSLQVLAETLQQKCGASPATETGRLELLRFLSSFVQGIPFSIPDAVGGGLRPPVSTLLYRLGDCDSKSLLLALLAQSCGIDAGLFVSFPDRHAMAAVAAPEPGGAGEEGKVPPALAAWSSLAGLPVPPPLWAEMPAAPAAEAPVRIYVPIESTVYSPVGRAHVGQPGTWVFLPLTLVRMGLPADGPASVERKDRAELEDRS